MYKIFKRITAKRKRDSLARIMDQMEDILVELTDTDLRKLTDMYKSRKAELPHIYSFLNNCVTAKTTGMPEFVTVFSPGNCWREDGTFIASMPHHGHDVVLHSLDPSGKNLVEGLSKTRRFKFLKDPARNYTYFYAIHEHFSGKILEVLENDLKQVILEVEEWNNAWCLNKDEALKRDIVQPPEVYVKPLEPKDIPIFNSIWPYRYPSSELYFLDCLKLTNGYGVYLKSTNQLVSWVAPSVLGQMTALQTVEEHKNKGYGGLAVTMVAKHLAEKGFDCFGTVTCGNAASEAVMEKLGFVRTFKCQYIRVHNNN